MAYVPCWKCGVHHKNIMQREIIVILSEFQAGNAQTMTGIGVLPMCILDVLKLPPAQKKMRELKEGRLVQDAGINGLEVTDGPNDGTTDSPYDYSLSRV